MKFILGDYISTYEDRLITLHLLPLFLWMEYLDITFLIRCTCLKYQLSLVASISTFSIMYNLSPPVLVLPPPIS